MKKASLLLLIILFVSPIFAAYNSKSVPDSSEIRKSLVEKWFEAPLSAVRMNLPEIYNNPANKFVGGFIGAPAMNFLKGKYVNGNFEIEADKTQRKIKDVY